MPFWKPTVLHLVKFLPPAFQEIGVHYLVHNMCTWSILKPQQGKDPRQPNIKDTSVKNNDF